MAVLVSQLTPFSMATFMSTICLQSVRIGTIQLEISFGCQPSPRTLGLVWDNQNLPLLDGSLNKV